MFRSMLDLSCWQVSTREGVASCVSSCFKKTADGNSTAALTACVLGGSRGLQCQGFSCCKQGMGEASGPSVRAVAVVAAVMCSRCTASLPCCLGWARPVVGGYVCEYCMLPLRDDAQVLQLHALTFVLVLQTPCPPDFVCPYSMWVAARLLQELKQRSGGPACTVGHAVCD